MNTQLRIAAAVAAVVVLALIVVNLVPKTVGVGGPSTPAPTATPVQTPSPAPSATPGALGVGEGLVPVAPGTYVAADPFLLRVTFTVPAGWEGNIGGPYAVFLQQAQGPGAVSFSIFEKVYADPCHYKGLLDPLPGPSVDDLATALSKVPGLGNPKPTDVTVAGYKGKQLTMTAPASFKGCTLTPDGAFRIWQLPLGATNDMTPGERDHVWILDVGGQRLVIDAPQPADETAAEAAEVQGVLDSIHLAPASPASSATASSTASSTAAPTTP